MKAVVVNYSKGLKFFHWLIALIVICMLGGSFFLDDLPKPYISTAFMIHKSFGITVLVLMLLRLYWLKHTGRPQLPPSMPAWEKFLSRFVQYSLYFFLIIQPLSGWIMSVAANRIPSYFGLIELPFPGISSDKGLATFMETCHIIIAWIIIGLLVLHVAGALKHHFINKDNVLRSMLPGQN